MKPPMPKARAKAIYAEAVCTKVLGQEKNVGSVPETERAVWVSYRSLTGR